MLYTINFKDYNNNGQYWEDELKCKLTQFAYEFKNVVNMYYSLIDSLENVNENNSDLQNDYAYQKDAGFELYKMLYDNLLRRFGIFCELNEIRITITINKNDVIFKQFASNHIFEIRSIYSL
jgi:hypothetical protein